MVVVDPLPLVQLSLKPAGEQAGSHHELAEGLGMLPAAGGAGAGTGTTGSGSSGSGSEAAAGPRSLRLLQGQVYSMRLAVTNTSKAPLGWASVNVR